MNEKKPKTLAEQSSGAKKYEEQPKVAGMTAEQQAKQIADL